MEEGLNFITGISHIGVLVADMEVAKQQYELLGFETKGELIREENFDIQALIMQNGAYVIELIAPLGKDSPLIEQLSQMKQYTMDHICYTVSDMEGQINLMKKNRFMVTSPLRISGVWNKRVVLLANRKMGVIELMDNN